MREAVNQLCQNGFIHNVKRKGLYCVQISREELVDLLELRQVLRITAIANVRTRLPRRILTN